MLKLDAAADVHHERLCVLRQAFEDTYQISQSFMNLRRIGDRVCREVAENLKLLRDVFERNTLRARTRGLAANIDYICALVYQLQGMSDSGVNGRIFAAVEKRIGALWSLANIATLIGLLGTVSGLIHTFAAVAAQGLSQSDKLLKYFR